LNTAELQAEFAEELAEGYKGEYDAGLYQNMIDKWFAHCFHDMDIMIYVVTTVTGKIEDSLRWRRAWYTFVNQYAYGCCGIGIADVIRVILEDNNNELYTRYLGYTAILDPSVA
jgi:hypothetical protein